MNIEKNASREPAARTCAVVSLLSLLSLPLLHAAAEDPPPAPRTPEEIARDSRAAVVVISSADRQGEARGIGTGFVVASDGVVATNYHVIGDRRPVVVQLSGGDSVEPTAILAVDRLRDLALLRIPGKDLPALELGDSDRLAPGQEVLSIGNPLGLEWSVARGVVAETRDLDGRRLVQVAMPIEPGSSGSPVIDRQGRVVGLLAIKSGDALGFAVPVNDLRDLMTRQRAVPMSRWLTIGALDRSEWETPLGGHWRQRAGKLKATGRGPGFGGRTLCLSSREVPEAFELEVEVRLEDESGAAGLAFHADGRHNHYGFYPTAGSLRLTRFAGPDVLGWTILETVQSDAYLRGEWNRLRVRVRDRRLTCAVNGEVVIDVEDDGFTSGRVGLVKFREPAAEFRRFRVARELEEPGIPDEVVAAVDEVVAAIAPDSGDDAELLERLAALGAETSRVLLERAVRAENTAARLRVLARRVHERIVLAELERVASSDDADPVHAALLVSKLDNEDLDVAAYLARIDRMAAVVERRLAEDPSDEQRLEVLIAYLFEELGFHASHLGYYQRANSYLNEVLEDREGIPITLSVVFTGLGRRLGLDLVGLGIPRHFIVGYRVGQEGERLIDPYNDGAIVDRERAAELSGTPLRDEDFKPATVSSIVARMLRNLFTVAEREQDRDGMARYIDAVLAIEPEATFDRWRRARLRFQTGDLEGLSEDVDWLLERKPPGIDLETLRDISEFLKLRLDERREKDAPPR